jgi:hypothetical protein
MNISYGLINILNESSTNDGDCVYPLKEAEYKHGDTSTLKGLDAEFIDYEVIDHVQHGREGMDFWEKLGEFLAPPAFPWMPYEDPICKLFPDCIVENEEDEYVSIIYSSSVCANIAEYLRRVSFQERHGPEWNMLTFKFCRQYGQLYALFRMASNDPKKGVQFTKEK